MAGETILLSIVLPALNEEKTIGICVTKALKGLKALVGRQGEVVVVDNGSSDKTAEIAKNLGARVVREEKRGYGNALTAGFRAAKGKYLIVVDADASYDPEEVIPIFFMKLQEGYDFVIGNRFRGKIEKGAMPFLHRYLGTPVLTGLANLFFKTHIGDVNCGMRGITREAFEKMRLRVAGMEFATEQAVKAALLKFKIAEVPCNVYKDKRQRKPHLRTWRDGWRHLRLMLLLAPAWTFFLPGFSALASGAAGLLFFLIRDGLNLPFLPYVNSRHILSSMLVFLTGCQITQLGLMAKAFSFSRRFDKGSPIMKWVSRYFQLERGILAGGISMLVGIFLFLYLGLSFYTSFLPSPPSLLRFDMAVFAAAFFLLGIQSIFASFVLSLFYLKIK